MLRACGRGGGAWTLFESIREQAQVNRKYTPGRRHTVSLADV